MIAAIPLMVLCAVGLPSNLPAAQRPADQPRISLAPQIDEGLRARVLEWWRARERRDHQRMYELYEPAYRQQVSFSDFLRESAIRTRYDVSNPRVISVSPRSLERVQVSVRIDTQIPRMPAGSITADEWWVFVSGDWFKVHEEPRLPFPSEIQKPTTVHEVGVHE